MTNSTNRQPLIITIDDEPAIRRSFKDFLEDSDFEVKEAENGSKGLSLVEQENPDLVLLDLSMPEMDGFQVLEQLKSKKPNLPVIVVSGIGVIRDAIKALKLGAWDYLLKPIEDLSILQHAVEKSLERASLISENQAYQQNLEIKVRNRTEELNKANFELNEINKKLSNSENKFRILAETSPMAIMMLQNEKLVYLNRSGEKITGFTFSEVADKHINFFFDDNSQGDSLLKVSHFLSNQPDYAREEMKITTKEGTEKWIDVSGGFTDLDGIPSGIISFIDITERKAFEVRLQNLNKELENRVLQRTSELETTNKEFKQAKEKADEATEAKSSFLANMSHEIRTPMNGVIAAVELALQEKVSPKIERFLKIIHSSGYSLLEIINDILDFSKIEAGKLSLEQTEFSINELLHEATNPFISSAFEKNIDLIFDIEPGTPNRFVGDRFRIVQILSNLLNNAIKFTDNLGTITIGVGTKGQGIDQDKAKLQFYVKDTGIGMSVQEQQRIFQPFTQADISTTRKFGGTGLGLSICKRLTELMGGTISVVSKKDVGTTFLFTVNVQYSPQSKNDFDEFSDEIQNKNILILDDNFNASNHLKSILLSFGCNPILAFSDEDAVKTTEQLAKNAIGIDFIIVDDNWPDNKKVDSFNIIRNKPATTKLILLSSLGHSQSDESGSLFPVCLYKPFTPSAVFDSLMLALDKKEYRKHPANANQQPLDENLAKALKGLDLLVAEDNPTNQEIVHAILENLGINSTIVSNGKEAIEMLQSRKFDGVLMDVQMPIMDGFEATKRIRSIPHFKSLPVIAMTAHAMKGDDDKCFNAGMSGYIAKPINQKVVFNTLVDLVSIQPNVNETSLNQKIDITEESSLPDTYKELNIAAALNSLSVNEAAYLRIINKFCIYHEAFPEKLEAAFQIGDWGELRRLAHSLNGSARNIGAIKTGEFAKTLESSIVPDTKTQPSTDKIFSALSDLIPSLKNLLEAIGETLVEIKKDKKTES